MNGQIVWTFGDTLLAFDREPGQLRIPREGVRDSATDITQYPYWIQSTQRWTSQRLSAGTNGTLAVTSDMVIFPQYAVNQATPFWSNYFNAWMLVHGTGFPTSQVMVMTAPKLEEPCTDSAGLAVTCTPNVTRGSTGYAITGHPEYESRARRSS